MAGCIRLNKWFIDLQYKVSLGITESDKAACVKTKDYCLVSLRCFSNTSNHYAELQMSCSWQL